MGRVYHKVPKTKKKKANNDAVQEPYSNFKNRRKPRAVTLEGIKNKRRRRLHIKFLNYKQQQLKEQQELKKKEEDKKWQNYKFL